MNDTLRFNPEQYEVKTLTLQGRTIRYRAFEGINYCVRPKDRVQKLNLYVPEDYYEGARHHGYDLHSAPIFMPNTVGGYMEGPAMEPGVDQFNGHLNTAFEALDYGYVVACAGIRGRNTGMASNEYFVGGAAGDDSGNGAGGVLVGRAPAFIIDMKAAIRYLRHNRDLIAGNTEHIITNGTSAGGALSALAGASGNAAVYGPYLEEIGAADERDDIFGASCYCPIHNLEHADMAYEWLFHDETTCHMVRFEKTDDGVKMVPVITEMDEKRRAVSADLRLLFPDYVNSLGLKNPDGNPLTLDAEGSGSFRDYVAKMVMASAQKELDTHWSAAKKGLAVPGSEIEDQPSLTIADGKVTGLDWPLYVQKITRMKNAPAFDDIAMNSPECEEFGDDKIFARHFTEYSEEHSDVPAELADPKIVKIMNPTSFIIRNLKEQSEATASAGSAATPSDSIAAVSTSVIAPHWRIRHGSFDRDTSLAIPTILALLLENDGRDVDFFLPWGLPHSGDYDLDQLFAWIDQICAE